MDRVREHRAVKKVTIVLSLVILTLFGSLVAVYVDLKNDNAALLSKINELQGKVSELQTNLNLSSTIEELQAQIRELQTNLTQVPSAAQVYNQSKSSVVLITTDKGYASGFVYDSQGYIVTNNHVVQDAIDINVTFFDGTAEPAQIIGTPDIYSDLALIKVNNVPAEFKPLPLRNSTSLMVGETVYAIGNPFGLANSITVGIISQLERLENFSDLNEPEPASISN